MGNEQGSTRGSESSNPRHPDQKMTSNDTHHILPRDVYLKSAKNKTVNGKPNSRCGQQPCDVPVELSHPQMSVVNLGLRFPCLFVFKPVAFKWDIPRSIVVATAK